MAKTADLIKEAPLVKIATIRQSDLGQVGFCLGLRLDDDGNFFQKETGAPRRELAVIGWFLNHRGEKCILLQRIDDGRLLKQDLLYGQGKLAAERYQQIFVR